MPAEIFKVIVSFVDAENKPLTGIDYTVKLLDQDRFFDDKLGASGLNPDGVAEFLIFAADIVSIDSADERTPDIYFVVSKSGREIFRSDVIADVKFDAVDPVTGRAKHLTQSFGPYRIEEVA